MYRQKSELCCSFTSCTSKYYDQNKMTELFISFAFSLHSTWWDLHYPPTVNTWKSGSFCIFLAFIFYLKSKDGPEVLNCLFYAAGAVLRVVFAHFSDDGLWFTIIFQLCHRGLQIYCGKKRGAGCETTQQWGCISPIPSYIREKAWTLHLNSTAPLCCPL